VLVLPFVSLWQFRPVFLVCGFAALDTAV
jgi:hypothetical protein